MGTQRKEDDDSERIYRSVLEAFELALRWMVVEDCKDRVNRYGPFDTHDEAEWYAGLKCAFDYEIIEMTDVRVFEERMGRHMMETTERMRYERAMQKQPREGDLSK